LEHRSNVGTRATSFSGKTLSTLEAETERHRERSFDRRSPPLEWQLKRILGTSSVAIATIDKRWSEGNLIIDFRLDWTHFVLRMLPSLLNEMCRIFLVSVVSFLSATGEQSAFCG